MNPLELILNQGQSIWYDFISRDFISSGKMAEYVAKGIRGMTSTPSIFEKAVASGNEYDSQITELYSQGKTTSEVATGIMIDDIKSACDILKGVYDSSNKSDGFISLEVNPKLAFDTTGTINEAEKLWSMINKPNLMIKIPATKEGLPAITKTISKGINVNVTLMFSLQQYIDVSNAYINGLEERLSNGGDISNINSVASVFVSRIDGMIDSQLDNIGSIEALNLKGKAAIANTQIIYQHYQNLFSSDRWNKIANECGKPQRPLWASTSTKDPSYPDLMYVDNLIAPNTVNTVPPETLVGILDHADTSKNIFSAIGSADEVLKNLSEVGIDINLVMQNLLEDGVSKFIVSFDGLFDKLESKRNQSNNSNI